MSKLAHDDFEEPFSMDLCDYEECDLIKPDHECPYCLGSGCDWCM